ncbi:hypothetical protein PFISCL1PPCAC_15931, partial [Pristionchus fissidentatus]
MHRIVLIAAIVAVALAADTHTKRQVLLGGGFPAFGYGGFGYGGLPAAYPGFVGGFGVPYYGSFGFPYTTYHVSAPVVQPVVTSFTTVTTTAAPFVVPVPVDTIKVSPVIAPFAPAVPVTQTASPAGTTKISIIQKD